jgi:hypothetical protein
MNYRFFKKARINAGNVEIIIFYRLRCVVGFLFGVDWDKIFEISA